MLLGVVISLGIFVFAGILYLQPAMQQLRAEREVLSQEKPPAEPKAPIVELPPIQEEVAPVEEPVPEATEEPEVVIQEPSEEDVEPAVEEPEVESIVEELEVIPPLVPEAPSLSMRVSQVPQEETIPEAQTAVEPITAEPVIEEQEGPAVEEAEREEPTEEVAKPRELPVIPVRRAPPAPKVTAEVDTLLPEFTYPEPVDYIWEPVEAPEGPIVHVNPVSFNEEASERRKNAVDDLFDRLIWE